LIARLRLVRSGDGPSLEHCILISEVSEFAGLGLAEPLLRAIADAGYTTPTPIQTKAIPVVLTGRDLLAAAQTGTGKTAGFTLPILQLLLSKPLASRKAGQPRCLILTPTRELTAQVAESVEKYGKHTRTRSLVVFGGVNINPQIHALRSPLDILVATPGRLLDHVSQRTVDLSAVEIFVLDEADRMLDMGFIPDIRRVIKLLPAKRQNLLFSATFSGEIRTLAKGMLNDPAEVEVAPRNTASELVTQTVHLVAKERKRALLSFLIGSNRWKQVLVFTKTKHGANRLAEQLGKDGIEAMAIHGNKSQGARTRALAQFKDGSLPVLVATDIAARGLDIDDLPHVVNYELPHVPEDYVHRIGRTGRAGREGSAVSLVDREEVKLLAAIERVIKRSIDRVEVEGFTGLNARPGDAELAQDDDRPPRSAPRGAPRGNSRAASPRQGHGQPQAHRAAQPQPNRAGHAPQVQQPRSPQGQAPRQPQRQGASGRSALTGGNGSGFRGTTGGK
jgi:ATP-dependent RNA helicase RhlE